MAIWPYKNDYSLTHVPLSNFSLLQSIPLPGKFCSFLLPSSFRYPISLLQTFYPFCCLFPQRSLQTIHLIYHLPLCPFSLQTFSRSLFYPFFLCPSSPSAPFFPKTLSCRSLPLTFPPLALFPASQLAFIFPRLDYCKALPVCQHSWKLFISAAIHLGRQREWGSGGRKGEGEREREGGRAWEREVCRGCK